MELSNKAQFVTRDEFYQIKKIDLQQELRGATDDDSSAPENFLFRVENKVINWLRVNYSFSEPTTTFQLVQFKLALIEQASQELYLGENADIQPSTKSYLQGGGMLNILRS